MNGPLRDNWEGVFRQYGVDIVFNGHMHWYEHSYVHGSHHVVTGGGGVPLQDPMESVAPGTVCRRHNILHYVRVTVDGDTMRVEMIPVASIYDGGVHPLPDGRPIDPFTVPPSD